MISIDFCKISLEENSVVKLNSMHSFCYSNAFLTGHWMSLEYSGDASKAMHDHDVQCIIYRRNI